ncbi:HesA/MoeB/ThiF family protein [Robiginitalea sediminis]|uniref:HesA/MoeB/ThiF family protein n=1 Tax=Robiginitalea sediminis TaxID=1982593 RepID=UPI000B4BF3E1|nr:HesA/MoeB/ThiF family protein [Robiginitalea sediminis]
MKSSRYTRQTRLEGFGPQSQERLSRARVLVVGAGGLGIPVATYLNAMGIGTLGLVDGDQVEWSNLHRQPAYGPEQVGKSKIAVLSGVLQDQNPDTQIRLYDTFLHPTNALRILEGYDLVVDATDNLQTRYLIDDACLVREIPWVYGALHGFEGQVSVFNYRGGPTYRCLFPEMPAIGEIPDCDTLGTLGVLPAIIGSLQALEAVKALCDLPGVLSGHLMLYQALEQQMQKIAFDRNPTREGLAPLETSSIPGCTRADGTCSVAEYQQQRYVPGTVLLDVREASEFKAKSATGAVNIPLLDLEENLHSLKDAGAIYVICKSGPRSRQAYTIIRETLPGTPVYWIEGGMRQYLAVCQDQSWEV